jgi:hypothetical protein
MKILIFGNINGNYGTIFPKDQEEFYDEFILKGF